VTPITGATALNACGTNDCHNNGQSLTLAAGAPANYTWGTPITNCVECHGDGTSMTSYATPST